MAYDSRMSRNEWGGLVSILITVIAQIAPIPQQLRWWITGICALALLICIIGWLASKDEAKQDGLISQKIQRSEITGSNVASAGGNVHQTIYQGLQPNDKKKEIREKLGEFLDKGEHWKSVCRNPKGDIFPGDRISLALG